MMNLNKLREKINVHGELVVAYEHGTHVCPQRASSVWGNEILVDADELLEARMRAVQVVESLQEAIKNTDRLLAKHLGVT